MILELQDVRRPWTLWFVRIVNNHGGRLHLRYVTSIDDGGGRACPSTDVHIFYLDRHVHSIGWTSIDPATYSYEMPDGVTCECDRQTIVDWCLLHSNKQFLPPNVFKEQQEIVKHRFVEGMKLEVFESRSQQIYVGRIGRVHNEFYFDVLIENNDDDDDAHGASFVAHSTHPHILPPHWAAEHKLTLMKGNNHRQSEDYWNLYSENHGIADLAPERCFNLITLNTAGSNRVEPGMKMEMVCTLNEKDVVFSVTLVHVADHLMWLRVDNPHWLDNEQLTYHVVPINSLDVFPIGWAKYNGLELILPLQYRINVRTCDQTRHE
jgi:hypothetical protein